MAFVAMSLCLTGCAGGMGRGSSRTLYTVLETMEVRDDDIGKDIQLKLDQKVLFKFKKTSPMGEWRVMDYEKRTLLFLTDTARVESDCAGILFQARGIGPATVDLVFMPDAEGQQPREVHFEISIRR